MQSDGDEGPTPWEEQRESRRGAPWSSVQARGVGGKSGSHGSLTGGPGLPGDISGRRNLHAKAALGFKAQKLRPSVSCALCSRKSARHMSQPQWASVQMPCKSGSASSTRHAPLTALVTHRLQNYLLTY